MAKYINGFFDLLALGFEKIPFLQKFSGYRAVIGYLGLAVTSFLWAKALIGTETALPILAGFEAFKDLALNAKGR